MLPDTGVDEVQTDRKMKTLYASFFRTLFVMLGALTLLAGPAKAAVALQDGSTTITYTAATAISQPFTVTAGASVLVVLETDRGNSATAPASLSYGSQTLVRAVTTSTTTVYRNVSIFYLFNPAPGTQNITGTANNASVWLSAYTLNGVDTNSPPLTGSVVSGGDTSVNFGVSGAPSNAWAAVNGIYANDTPAGTFTITGSGGTPAIDSNANDTSYDSMGYIASLAAGTDTFTYTLTSGGTGTQKMALTAAVFTPLGVPGAPVMTTQPQSQSLVAGQTAIITAAVSGTGPLFYQWQSNGTNLTDGAGISGSLTNTLTLSNLNANEAGSYSLVITNAYGSVTSAP
ncbi:MAG TPA: immunoglobulin domain-containing protein, partial [Candidatus Paceibacterota bacterium]|nr:immunoglobulin domain-containing protein [Candidatus Paceibacterota bacterium]